MSASDNSNNNNNNNHNCKFNKIGTNNKNTNNGSKNNNGSVIPAKRGWLNWSSTNNLVEQDNTLSGNNLYESDGNITPNTIDTINNDKKNIIGNINGDASKNEEIHDSDKTLNMNNQNNIDMSLISQNTSSCKETNNKSTETHIPMNAPVNLANNNTSNSGSWWYYFYRSSTPINESIPNNTQNQVSSTNNTSTTSTPTIINELNLTEPILETDLDISEELNNLPENTQNTNDSSIIIETSNNVQISSNSPQEMTSNGWFSFLYRSSTTLNNESTLPPQRITNNDQDDRILDSLHNSDAQVNPISQSSLSLNHLNDDSNVLADSNDYNTSQNSLPTSDHISQSRSSWSFWYRKSTNSTEESGNNVINKNINDPIDLGLENSKRSGTSIDANINRSSSSSSTASISSSNIKANKEKNKTKDTPMTKNSKSTDKEPTPSVSSNDSSLSCSYAHVHPSDNSMYVTPLGNLVLPSIESCYPKYTRSSALKKKISSILENGINNNSLPNTSSMSPFHIKHNHGHQLYLYPSHSSVIPYKIVLLGVHGFFPIKMVRSLFGEPTGTSKKFVTECEQAVRRWAATNLPQADQDMIDICTIALEGEGTVSARVEKLYPQIIRHIEDVRNADAVIFAAHSQGTIVAFHLLAKLIEQGLVSSSKTSYAGILGMAGVSHGPFIGLDQRLVMRAYTQFESDALRELFAFQNPHSVQYQDYIQSVKIVLEKLPCARIILVASANDQVVPFYSALFASVSHPHIFRAVFVDGTIHAPDFLSYLLGFVARCRNVGLWDHSLIRELSGSIAGTLTGGGHSRIYYEPTVYDLALRSIFETVDVESNAKVVLDDLHISDSFKATTASIKVNNAPKSMQGISKSPGLDEDNGTVLKIDKNLKNITKIEENKKISSTSSIEIQRNSVLDNSKETGSESAPSINTSSPTRSKFLSFTSKSTKPKLIISPDTTSSKTPSIEKSSERTPNKVSSYSKNSPKENITSANNSNSKVKSSSVTTSKTSTIPSRILFENNVYLLPWAMRGLLDEKFVREHMRSDVDKLFYLYSQWEPESKSLKDLRYRLSALKLSKL